MGNGNSSGDASVQSDASAQNDASDAASSDTSVPDCSAKSQTALPAPQVCTGDVPVFRTSLAGPDFRSQLFGDIVFDGSSFWIAYGGVAPGESDLRGYLTRLSCDGTVDGTVRIDPCLAGQSTRFSLARASSSVAVSWTNSNGDGSIYLPYQVFDPRGQARFHNAKLLDVKVGGNSLPTSGVATYSDIIALQSSEVPSFGITVARSNSASERNAYLQRVDLEGGSFGDARVIEDSSDGIADLPTATSDGEDYIVQTAIRQTDGSGQYQVASSFFDGILKHNISSEPGATAASFVPGNPKKAVAAFTTIGTPENSMQLRTIKSDGQTASFDQTINISEPGSGAYFSFEASGLGVMFWLDRVGGLVHQLMATPLDWSGDQLLVGNAEMISLPGNVPPENFPLRSVAVGDDTYAVAVSAGTHPDYDLWVLTYKPLR